MSFQGYFYVVSNASHRPADYDVWFGLGPCMLPMGRASYIGILSDVLRLYRWSIRLESIDPVHGTFEQAMMDMWGLDNVSMTLFYFFPAWDGSESVDCYWHRAASAAVVYGYSLVTDISSPLVWYLGREYGGSIMLQVPEWETPDAPSVWAFVERVF